MHSTYCSSPSLVPVVGRGVVDLWVGDVSRSLHCERGSELLLCPGACFTKTVRACIPHNSSQIFKMGVSRIFAGIVSQEFMWYLARNYMST